jgi:hypothetical protein
VAYVGEAMLGSHSVCPLLNCGPNDFDCCAALPAHEVVMMGSTALSVNRLTIISNNHVNFTAIDESLKCAVHRGEADTFTVLAQMIM